MEVANNRKHGTTRLCPLEQLHSVELEKLKSLPTLAFEREEYHWGSVRRDGHVRFRGKYYSLAESFIGKDVFVIGTYSTVSIFYQNKLIETHGRLHFGNTSKSTKVHHRKIAEQIMGDNELYIKRAEKIGEFTKEFIRKILLQGNGFVDTRKVWGVLSLDKKYSHLEIESACEYALLNDDLKYRAIVGYLEARKKEIYSEKNQQEEHRFIRNIEEYIGQLALPLTQEKKICH
jgi:hypothetical protein